MELVEYFENLYEVLLSYSDKLDDILLSLGYIAPLISSLLIFLEGIFAFLPLFVFITVNVITLGEWFGVFGTILAYVISWICTTLGSFATVCICRKGFSGLVTRFIKGKKGLTKLHKKINKMKYSQLVLVISIPFMPSFFINCAAGLSKIPLKKYFYALLLGKVFVVLFCGYIGTSLIECLTNPIKLLEIIGMVVFAYVGSNFISKKFDLDERF